MMNFPPLKEQMDIIRRGASEIIPEDELVKKLEILLTIAQRILNKVSESRLQPTLYFFSVKKNVLLITFVKIIIKKLANVKFTF